MMESSISATRFATVPAGACCESSGCGSPRAESSAGSSAFLFGLCGSSTSASMFTFTSFLDTFIALSSSRWFSASTERLRSSVDNPEPDPALAAGFTSTLFSVALSLLTSTSPFSSIFWAILAMPSNLRCTADSNRCLPSGSWPMSSSILFLHSSLCFARYFDPLIAALHPAHPVVGPCFSMSPL